MKILTLLFVLGFAVPAFAAEPSCVLCHGNVRDQFAGSVHERAGLSCVDCHGGDPKAEDGGHDAGLIQRAKNKKEIAESCAKCHSDVRRMNPYGLPTDQLDHYKTSRHGQLLYGNNDQNVATCTDCHGVHDIHKSRAATSHTHPHNIPQTCGRCHSDSKLMSKYNLPSDQVALYKSSYHGYLLFTKGDLSAPTCVTCHGNHGATPPGTEQVPQVCGKCHVRQRELFARSPHATAADKGAFKQCISCHGNHGIQQTSVRLLDQSCVRCHAKDPGPLAARDLLINIIQTAKNSFERASERVHAATLRGLATDDEELLLQEARTQIMQLEVLQHTLAADDLRPAATRLQEVLQQIINGVNRLEQVEVWKRRGVVSLWAFLGMMAVLFWVKRMRIEWEER